MKKLALLGVVAVLLLAGCSSGVTAPTDNQIAALQQRIADLEQQVAAFKAIPGPQGSPGPGGPPGPPGPRGLEGTDATQSELDQLWGNLYGKDCRGATLPLRDGSLFTCSVEGQLVGLSKKLDRLDASLGDVGMLEKEVTRLRDALYGRYGPPYLTSDDIGDIKTCLRDVSRRLKGLTTFFSGANCP